MKLPMSPVSRILREMHRIAVAAHVADQLGYEEAFTIRHYRHRPTSATERNCMALRLSVDRENEDFDGATMAEVARIAEIDLVVDMDIPPEDEDAGEVDSNSDLTGWDHLYAAALTFARLYLAEDSDLRAIIDDVVPGDIDPDEDSKPDEGRLVISLYVLYRVRFDDPLHLLSIEENAQ